MAELIVMKAYSMVTLTCVSFICLVFAVPENSRARVFICSSSESVSQAINYNYELESTKKELKDLRNAFLECEKRINHDGSASFPLIFKLLSRIIKQDNFILTLRQLDGKAVKKELYYMRKLYRQCSLQDVNRENLLDGEPPHRINTIIIINVFVTIAGMILPVFLLILRKVRDIRGYGTLMPNFNILLSVGSTIDDNNEGNDNFYDKGITASLNMQMTDETIGINLNRENHQELNLPYDHCHNREETGQWKERPNSFDIECSSLSSCDSSDLFGGDSRSESSVSYVGDNFQEDFAHHYIREQDNPNNVFMAYSSDLSIASDDMFGD